MEPNKLGLIRQKGLDLLSLPLDKYSCWSFELDRLIDFGDLSDCKIDILPVNYTHEESALNKSGSIISNYGKSIGEVDGKGYDFVLVYVYCHSLTCFSGTAIGSYGSITNNTVCGEVLNGWMIFETRSRPYVRISTDTQRRQDFAIGIKKINADSKSLQLAKADKLNQEADRIRDGVSGDVKEPVLDSLAGDRTATSGDGEADS